jgi:hypothetical protein
MPRSRTRRPADHAPRAGRARRYKGWSEAVGKAAASVAVLYASDYGFSDRLSQTLARGITKAGVATDMVDLLSADPQVRPGRARAPRPAPGCSAV